MSSKPTKFKVLIRAYPINDLPEGYNLVGEEVGFNMMIAAKLLDEPEGELVVSTMFEEAGKKVFQELKKESGK